MDKRDSFLKYTILAVICIFLILGIIEGLDAFYKYQRHKAAYDYHQQKSKSFIAESAEVNWNYHPKNGILQDNETSNP